MKTINNVNIQGIVKSVNITNGRIAKILLDVPTVYYDDEEQPFEITAFIFQNLCECDIDKITVGDILNIIGKLRTNPDRETFVISTGCRKVIN